MSINHLTEWWDFDEKGIFKKFVMNRGDEAKPSKEAKEVHRCTLLSSDVYANDEIKIGYALEAAYAIDVSPLLAEIERLKEEYEGLLEIVRRNGDIIIRLTAELAEAKKEPKP